MASNVLRIDRKLKYSGPAQTRATVAPGTVFKAGAHSRGLPLQITREDAEAVLVAQGGKCAFTGWEIRCFPKDARTASLDRIDSSLGYVPGNVQWVHKDLNMFKGAMPDERFIDLCLAVAKYRGAK